MIDDWLFLNNNNNNNNSIPSHPVPSRPNNKKCSNFFGDENVIFKRSIGIFLNLFCSHWGKDEAPKAETMTTMWDS
jgi:hypothetical protein